MRNPVLVDTVERYGLTVSSRLAPQSADTWLVTLQQHGKPVAEFTYHGDSERPDDLLMICMMVINPDLQFALRRALGAKGVWELRIACDDY